MSSTAGSEDEGSMDGSVDEGSGLENSSAGKKSFFIQKVQPLNVITDSVINHSVNVTKLIKFQITLNTVLCVRSRFAYWVNNISFTMPHSDLIERLILY